MKRTVLFLAFSFFSFFSFAQGGFECDPDIPDPSCDSEIPLDKGVVFLVIAAVYFGVKKLGKG
jgi:hypothetical protein